jgi:hypothetical protein
MSGDRPGDGAQWRTPAERIRKAEMAASLRPPLQPDDDRDEGALWFALGAGISLAAVAVAAVIG